MASKIFLDANVILDFTLKRSNYDGARKLFSFIVDQKVNAFTTPAVIHVTGYWLTKAYGSSWAGEVLLELLSVVEIIDAAHQVILVALHSRLPDIEDALQYYTALHHQMDYFISDDKRLRKWAIASLPVYAVDEFLKQH